MFQTRSLRSPSLALLQLQGSVGSCSLLTGGFIEKEQEEMGSGERRRRNGKVRLEDVGKKKENGVKWWKMAKTKR